jgi:hypothetical protein
LFFQVKQQVLKDLQQPKLMNSANKLWFMNKELLEVMNHLCMI